MLIQTPLHYARLYYSTGIVFESDKFYDEDTKDNIAFNDENEENRAKVIICIDELRKYCDYFTDVSTLDYYLCQFSEEIAAMA